MSISDSQEVDLPGRKDTNKLAREMLARWRANWVRHAGCWGSDPDLFYPWSGDKKGSRMAKEVCEGCVVRWRCGEYAVATGEHLGIWGGMSMKERVELRRKRGGRWLGKSADMPGWRAEQVLAAYPPITDLRGTEGDEVAFESMRG